MDIIDVLVAKSLTPQGQIDAYAARARQAVSNATTVLNTANAAVENISTITEQTNINNANAQAAVQNANQAIENATAAVESVEDALEHITEAVAEGIDPEIDKLRHSITQTTTTSQINYNLVTTYPSGMVQTLQNLIRYYTSTGNNTDGTMTQKAITDKFDELEREIDQGGSGIHFNPNDAGYMPVITDSGTLSTSNITEDDLVEALAKLGIYHMKDTVGLTIDYESRTFKRVQEAEGLNPGADFDKYPMYGGRKRCNVNTAGRITAWYGDSNFKDDGSNGDVMIYQPKFYYQRIPLKVENGTVGKIIRQETISITGYEQPGFKIHPAFLDTDDNILEYILLPAYESCYYDASAARLIKDDSGTIDFNADSLRSCSDAKPVSGVRNQLTIENAEHMATNHGTGWHITNAAAESANQMLALIEFGTMNGQTALESGLSNLPNTDGVNCASQTGSTASLGDTTGIAESTINITNGRTNEYNIEGRRAITYRGMENPWGNIWRFIGGLLISGNGSQRGGIPYVCADFNYTPSQQSNNYVSADFSLPASNGWISAMGYGNTQLDWLLMPAEATGANSVLPVGDNIWVTSSLNGIRTAVLGGNWQLQDNNGSFYYGCDNLPTAYSRVISARIMHIPTINSTTYTSNITSWINKMQG